MMTNRKEFALTTSDNPFDPISNFDEWKRYDENVLGYFTCNYLGRIALTSNDLSDEDNDAEIERAIDEIVSLNPYLYVKVFGVNKSEENDKDSKDP